MVDCWRDVWPTEWRTRKDWGLMAIEGRRAVLTYKQLQIRYSTDQLLMRVAVYLLLVRGYNSKTSISAEPDGRVGGILTGTNFNNKFEYNYHNSITMLWVFACWRGAKELERFQGSLCCYSATQLSTHKDNPLLDRNIPGMHSERWSSSRVIAPLAGNAAAFASVDDGDDNSQSPRWYCSQLASFAPVHIPPR